MPVVAGLAAVTFAWLVWTALRRPHLRRLAFRYYSRRPNETALVVAGSILGTALIVGSFITGDSLNHAFTQRAYDTLGEVDEQVQLTLPGSVQRARKELGKIRALNGVDGAVIVETDTGAARNPEEKRRTEARVQVYSLNLTELDTFGSTKQSVRGPDVAAGSTVVTQDLADALGLEKGSDIDLLLYGTTRTFRVARIADGPGFASYRDGKNLFVAPGVLQEMATAAGGKAKPKTEMWVSNRGDAAGGRELSFPVQAELQRILGDRGVKVITVKNSAVEIAQSAADSIGTLFTICGSFAVIAGLLLLVNIFVMLAAERKSEMGMLRAVGLTRADLVRSFVMEGALYSSSAAVLGGLAGVGVGAAIVGIASTIFTRSSRFTGGGSGSVRITLILDPATVVIGALTGFAIAFITITVTSFFVGRINIIAAIRDLDPEKVKKKRLLPLILGLVVSAIGAVVGVAGIAGSVPVPAILGPTFLALGLTPLLSRMLPRRIAVSIVSGAILAWSIVLPLIVPNLLGQEGGPVVFMIQGIVTTFSAVGLLSQNQELLSGLVRKLAAARPRAGLAARLATTYPVARRFRTAMTLTMYALIVFTLVMITIIGYVQQLNTLSFARRESAGYDVLLRTNVATPMTEKDVLATRGVKRALPLPTSPGQMKAVGSDQETFVSVYGVTDDFRQFTNYSLVDWDRSFGKTPKEIWERLQSDPKTVVIDRTYNGSRNQGPPNAIVIKVGQDVELTDPVSGRKVVRKLIGYSNSTLALPGVFLGEKALKDQFTAAGNSTWLVQTDSDASPNEVADQIQADNTAKGVQAIAFRKAIADVMSINLQFFGLLRGYLALGLIVGIVGLGVVMIRAVRERRRAIGILRALGFASRTVRRAFIGEAGLVAFEGILLGTALGVITARNVLTSSIAKDFDVPFAVPWGTLLLLGGVALVFSLIVSALPARAASKIRPAVALRVAD